MTRTAAAKARSRKAPAAAAPADPNDRGPEDIDEFRMSLVRRMLALKRLHALCPERACRRRRACVGAAVSCLALLPPRVSTPQEEAQDRAAMKRALDAHIGRGGG